MGNLYNLIIRNAKSFIRRLLVADITIRLGSNNNSQDIFDHRWFKGYDWDGIIYMKHPAFHTPRIK